VTNIFLQGKVPPKKSKEHQQQLIAEQELLMQQLAERGKPLPVNAAPAAKPTAGDDAMTSGGACARQNRKENNRRTLQASDSQARRKRRRPRRQPLRRPIRRRLTASSQCLLLCHRQLLLPLWPRRIVRQCCWTN